MRAMTHADVKNIKPKKSNAFRGSTAFYIFDKENQYPFLIDRVHFKMNNGTHAFPEYFGSSARGVRSYDMSKDLIPTYGTIIQMSDFYHDGAVISIRDKKVAADIYKRILAHMDAHLNAMRSDIHYIAPKDDVLVEIAEFATAIRYKALELDPDIDETTNKSQFLISGMAARAFISETIIEKKEVTEIVKQPPKSVKMMDAIERYLDMVGR